MISLEIYDKILGISMVDLIVHMHFKIHYLQLLFKHQLHIIPLASNL